MSKHTEGPWGIEQTSDKNWIGPLRQSGDGKIDSIVCSTERGSLTEAAQMSSDANAELIAAAPDLLAALKEIAQGRGRFSNDQLEFASNTIESMKAIANAAIAKAEGK